MQTDLEQIHDTIDRAATAVSSLYNDLGALTEEGWDVNTYVQQATTFATAVGVARAKQAENYIDEPTRIARATTAEALEFREKAGALKTRRMAADEAYGTQAGRLASTRTTAETVRVRFVRLQDTYNPGCLVNFENFPQELVDTLAKLASAHEDGARFTGEQGRSVEAVVRSEELNSSFDTIMKEMAVLDEELQERENHLADLAAKLPRRVRKLSLRFDRAMELINDPELITGDVEGDTMDEIRSLADDIATLSASMTTADGQKPNYLDIEKRHHTLATDLGRAHSEAERQIQEIATLRANVPALTQGYNDLITVVKGFAGRIELRERTRRAVNALQPYEFDPASDRQGLHEQYADLEELLQGAHNLMNRVEKAANKDDDSLLTAAKVAGGFALAIIGINILGS